MIRTFGTDSKQISGAGERCQRHVPRRPIISEKRDEIGFNPSHGMLQAEGSRRGLAGLAEHAPIQPPPKMAVKGVLRVLLAHGPLRFESIASHLEQSHSSSLVRECLQCLEAGQKVRETALSKELHNNHGKVDSIEKLYWVASSGGASSEFPPRLVSLRWKTLYKLTVAMRVANLIERGFPAEKSRYLHNLEQKSTPHRSVDLA